MYYVYIIKNRRENQTYIGYTNDLKRRFKEHKDKRPEMIYYEAYKSEQDARLRERKLKQRGQTVRRLKERLVNSLK
ncbi:MAG: GIY-YIG nuclease family protein [Patescibacteria group bacterium]